MDHYTLTITYAAPAPLTAKRLAMWVNANIGPRWIAPKHYLKPFHPKYNPDVKNFEEFVQKVLFRQNPECPSLSSWICTKYVASQSVTWDRNPYYYAVDTEGNQLPYIDGIDEVNHNDRQADLLLIRQGSIDFTIFTKT